MIEDGEGEVSGGRCVSQRREGGGGGVGKLSMSVFNGCV